MKIKTIRTRLDNAETFDTEVNTALAEGWRLGRRDVLNSGTPDKHTMLIAELVQLDPAPEPQKIDPVAAARVIAEECCKHDSCRTCALDGICNCTPPYHWFEED